LPYLTHRIGVPGMGFDNVPWWSGYASGSVERGAQPG